MRRMDLILGITLGVILGVGIVVIFVFTYSERTVDAPSISHQDQTAATGGGGGRSGGHRPPPVATVRVAGGAPPPSGPPQLHYRKGEEIRLRLVSDETVRLQLRGLGVARTAYSGQPVGWQFKARLSGDFPLVVARSHIDVATIAVR